MDNRLLLKMKICTFFGHRNCPSNIAPLLDEVITDLILTDAVTMFYVGNQGQFDSMVRNTLKRVAMRYSTVNYAVVLAYMPKEKQEAEYTDYSDTMLPEGIETVPPRFAISWRNKWMLKQADIVVTYITHSWGGCCPICRTGKTATQTSYQYCRYD